MKNTAPVKKRKPENFYIDESLKLKLKVFAAQKGRTMSDVVETAIKKYMGILKESK